MENEIQNQSATPGTTTRSLIGKLASVMAEISRVKKNGVNTFQRYNYATEADLVEEVRQKLGSRGVFIFTNVEEVTERDTGRKTTSGLNIRITRVKAKHIIRDSDSDETMEITSYGEGEDSGDKGIYKALTGAVKYFISKNFLMSTGDDPENDEAEAKPEKQKTSKQARPTFSNGVPFEQHQAEQAPPPQEPLPIRQDYTPARDAAPERSAPPEPPLAENQCRDFVVDIQMKTGPKKDGSNYTRYSIQTRNNGFFTTFSQSFADIAMEAKNTGEEVFITFKVNGRWKDMEAIRTTATSNGYRPALVGADPDSLPF